MINIHYLLVIHLPSQHLWGHPVGGANDSQRALLLVLATGKETKHCFILKISVPSTHLLLLSIYLGKGRFIDSLWFHGSEHVEVWFSSHCLGLAVLLLIIC